MSVGYKQGISVEPPNAAYTTGHLARAAGESISYSTETFVTSIVMEEGSEKGRGGGGGGGENFCELIGS